MSEAIFYKQMTMPGHLLKFKAYTPENKIQYLPCFKIVAQDE